MGLRFSKRIKILPGVTLNLSKSGLSTSFGPRGAKVTLRQGKTRTTVGIPGSGLSHTSLSSNNTRDTGDTPSAAATIVNLIWIALGVVVVYFVFSSGLWVMLF